MFNIKILAVGIMLASGINLALAKTTLEDVKTLPGCDFTKGKKKIGYRIVPFPSINGYIYFIHRSTEGGESDDVFPLAYFGENEYYKRYTYEEQKFLGITSFRIKVDIFSVNSEVMDIGLSIQDGVLGDTIEGSSVCRIGDNRFQVGIEDTFSRLAQRSHKARAESQLQLARLLEVSPRNVVQTFDACSSEELTTIKSDEEICGKIIYTGFGVLGLEVNSDYNLPSSHSVESKLFGRIDYNFGDRQNRLLTLWGTEGCGNNLYAEDCELSKKYDISEENQVCLKGDLQSKVLFGFHNDPDLFIEKFSQTNVCPSAMIINVK